MLSRLRIKYKPSVKQPVAKNRSNRILTSAIRFHICTCFDLAIQDAKSYDKIYYHYSLIL